MVFYVLSFDFKAKPKVQQYKKKLEERYLSLFV